MLKRIVKIFLIVLVGGLVLIQLFRIDKTNPPIVAADTLEAAVNVPPDIKLILGRSCNDCHSHQTVYPWYSNIQPSGWFLKDHVEHGKEHLNFSVFNTYDAQKKAKMLEEICEEVEKAAMPLPSYLWIHRDAVVSKSEGQALCDWTANVIKKLES